GKAGCGRVSAFDAEMMGICMGLCAAVSEAREYLVTDLHIFCDNEAALNAILDPGLHSSQMQSILSCQRVRGFLEQHESHTIHLHWMPAHIGFEPSEFVDEAAKEAANRGVHPSSVSMSWARSRTVTVMMGAWRKDISRPDYRGHQFELPKKTLKGGISHIAKQHFALKNVGHDASRMARLTRVLTGHAPIGAYRARFNLPGPAECACGAASQTREHLLFECRLWI
ncbi:hypothetical protein BXZ70DRAFT_869703, partial [Cristinia sonorae]